MGSTGREEENLVKEGSPVEILWCVENPKGQAVLSVLLLCQGQGAILATLQRSQHCRLLGHPGRRQQMPMLER